MGQFIMLALIKSLFGSSKNSNAQSHLKSAHIELNSDPDFKWIEFRDLNNVEFHYRPAFTKAQERLNAILSNQASQPVNVDGHTINGILIDASTSNIDGEGNILGFAGPSHIRKDSKLPVIGIMQFDNADLDRLLARGELSDVILHEMFHALGAGPLWSYLGLTSETNSNNPQFIGPRAVAEYQTLLGESTVSSIPVANTGGQGTRNGHWRESVFGIELNTGFLNGKHRPLSRMSIAALSDLGYTEPRLDLADPYQLPVATELQSLEALHFHQCDICTPEFHEVN